MSPTVLLYILSPLFHWFLCPMLLATTLQTELLSRVWLVVLQSPIFGQVDKIPLPSAICLQAYLVCRLPMDLHVSQTQVFQLPNPIRLLSIFRLLATTTAKTFPVLALQTEVLKVRFLVAQHLISIRGAMVQVPRVFLGFPSVRIY